MQDDREWIKGHMSPLLQYSEAYYRSIGYAHTADLMNKAFAAVDKRGHVGPSFLPDYAKALKEDCVKFIETLGIDSQNRKVFSDSFQSSIEDMKRLLDELSKAGNTKIFGSFQVDEATNQRIAEFMQAHGEEVNRLSKVEDAEKSLATAREFYHMYEENIYAPAAGFVSKCLEDLLGCDVVTNFVQNLFSVRGTFSGTPKTRVADIIVAFNANGKLTEEKDKYLIDGKLLITVQEMCLWPLMMYHKVPILTSMLPVFNVVTLSNMDIQIDKKEKEQAKAKGKN